MNTPARRNMGQTKATSLGQIRVTESPVADLERSRVQGASERIDWNTQHAVYFSNLTTKDVSDLHTVFLDEPRYMGYIDVSYTSPVRDYVASTLVSQMLVCDGFALVGHGVEEPVIGSDDPMGFGFSRHGLRLVSLMDDYFDTFLTYKVEIGHTAGAEMDRTLNLAAVTGAIIDVESCPILVPASKLDEYLLKKHDRLRLMTRIGLQDVTPDELAGVIREKLLQSYVYDLKYADEGTPTFAVTAEFLSADGTPIRQRIALKYDADEGAIGLVSVR